MEFDKNTYHGYFIRRDVVGAMEYIKQFPEQADLYNRFVRIYAQEHYITYQIDDDLNRILTVYQRYYREAFYLCIGREQAEYELKRRLAALFEISDQDAGLPDLEQNLVAEAFRNRGMHFRGGKTDGYYGPYIWRTTETAAYEVELPEGTQTYKVKLLDGFIAKSWMDYISFGEIGTGGWTDSDGVICCVKSSYDFDSEDFRVSLLKHEAQHAWDLAHSPDMSSEDLEYRAKLVELIYSRQRNLLRQFAVEADGSDDPISGHAAASRRIVEGIAGIAGRSTKEVSSLSIGQIQWAAEKLFARSGFSFSDE